MKVVFLLLLMGNIAFIGHAQNNTADTTDYTKEVQHVEIPPVFPGGTSVWKLYLQRNGLKPGLDSSDTQTAVVSFLVDKEGKTAEVTIKMQIK